MNGDNQRNLRCEAIRHFWNKKKGIICEMQGVNPSGLSGIKRENI
jgi:hypothetical protein